MGSLHSSKQSQLQPYAVLPKTLNRTCGLKQIKGHHQKAHSYSWLGGTGKQVSCVLVQSFFHSDTLFPECSGARTLAKAQMSLGE